LPPEEQLRFEEAKKWVIPVKKIRVVYQKLADKHRWEDISQPNLSHLSRDRGYSWKISQKNSIVIAGLAKVFLSELIEEAKLIQVEEKKLEMLSKTNKVSVLKYLNKFRQSLGQPL
jgi:hypothetical protein